MCQIFIFDIFGKQIRNNHAKLIISTSIIVINTSSRSCRCSLPLRWRMSNWGRWNVGIPILTLNKQNDTPGICHNFWQFKTCAKLNPSLRIISKCHHLCSCMGRLSNSINLHSSSHYCVVAAIPLLWINQKKGGKKNPLVCGGWYTKKRPRWRRIEIICDVRKWNLSLAPAQPKNRVHLEGWESIVSSQMCKSDLIEKYVENTNKSRVNLKLLNFLLILIVYK